MLKALADGENQPSGPGRFGRIQRLRRHTGTVVRRARRVRRASPVYRRLLKMALEELRLIDEQIGQLDQEMANLLSQHQDAVKRLAEVPGLEWTQRARSLPKRPYLSGPFPPRNVSPLGWCLPGDDESAG